MKHPRELSPKTRDEHEATAMLLGKAYSWTFHAFYDVQQLLGDKVFIDADTMELLGERELVARLDTSINKGHGK